MQQVGKAPVSIFAKSSMESVEIVDIPAQTKAKRLKTDLTMAAQGSNSLETSQKTPKLFAHVRQRRVGHRSLFLARK